MNSESPSQGWYGEAPAKRSSQQPVNQQQRRTSAGFQKTHALSLDPCPTLVYLHVARLQGNRSLSVAFQTIDIASVPLSCGTAQPSRIFSSISVPLSSCSALWIDIQKSRSKFHFL